MPDRHYISTDSAAIFIRGWWVDDAVGIQYQVQDPKEPLYGYRRKNWTDVAEGNVIVHGMLDINFRYKGYLLFLLSQVGSLKDRVRSAEEQDAQGLGGTKALEGYNNFKRALEPDNNFIAAGIDPRQITAENRKKLLEASVEDFDLARFRRLAGALQEDIWNAQPYQTRFEKVRSERNRPGLWPDGFDLDIVFQQNAVDDLELAQDPGLVEKLIDVRIVGQSKILQNTVPGGGEPLIERYQFIAQNLK